MTIVEIQGLTKAYGKRPPALRDVDLEIGEGVTGLLGPNGAGKSTLIQCVLGLLPNYTGQVKVLGLDARTQTREIRRRVGFMPETDCYLEDMTGLNSVRYLGQLTGMPYNDALRRAHEILHHVGLGEAVFRKVKEYSTGMRQRFKLAQALVHDPELIFLDEPLAGLDPGARDELLKLIRDLVDIHGKHVVWSSHILPDVQKVADSIIVLNNGRSRGEYRLKDLQLREGRFEVEALGDFAGLRERFESADIPVLSAESNDAEKSLAPGGTFLVDVSDPSPRRIFAALAEDGIHVRRVEPLPESLEDLFERILEDDEGQGATQRELGS